MDTPPLEELSQDYAARLRQRMQDAHGRAQMHLKKSARRQKRNYDRGIAGKKLGTGQFVWLFNPAKKKGLAPKLQCRWEGPYLIVGKLSDVTFRVQLQPRSRAKVVHYDRLKCYEGEPLRGWEYEIPPGKKGPTLELVEGAPSGKEAAEGPPEVETLEDNGSDGVVLQGRSTQEEEDRQEVLFEDPDLEVLTGVAGEEEARADTANQGRRNPPRARFKPVRYRE